MFAITLYDIIRLVIAFLSSNTITGPVTTKKYKLACAPIEDSDQAAHPLYAHANVYIVLETGSFLLASYGAQLTYGQLMFLRLSFFVFIYKYSFTLS